MLKFIIGSILMFLLVFFVLRIAIALIIGYILNNSNIRKRKNKQSFRQWLFYVRFKDVIPLSFKIWYYGNMAICGLFIVLYIVVDLLEMNYTISILGKNQTVEQILLLIHIIISVVPLAILHLRTLDFNSLDKINIANVINGRKTQKKSQKKKKVKKQTDDDSASGK